MMYVTSWLSDDSDNIEEERKNFTDETVRLAEKIMDECLDDQYRHGAVQLLCSIYSRNGNTDRTVELAQKMPYMAVSREFLYADIYKGTEGYECDKRLIYNLIQFLTNLQPQTRRRRTVLLR